ncbi:MAG: radical SAM protein [Desulfobacteraceae bacterium]|nr:radical SAM protein [Desulfobacteraceae bacterium]
MTIFLINPVCMDARVMDEDARSVPMGLFHIGALLKENQIDARVINLAVETDPEVCLAALIRRFKPSILGFTLLNATRFSAMSLAKIAKGIDPGITVIFGGPGATFLSEHLFSVCPELDYIVTGEGEFTFLELAEHVAAGRSTLPHMIKGLMFRDGEKLVHTGEREPIKDLDTLPKPGRYFDLQHLSLSRGCPGRCTFCGSPQFWPGPRVRFHSPKWFVDHLELLVNRGITHFFVSDDTFTMDRARVIEVCQTIIRRGLTITWVAISRVDFLDGEILSWMRRAGCTQISFGVESGSAAIRKTLGKPVARDRIVQAFKLTASFGILPRAYFIYGSPGESEETIRESLDLLMEIRPLSAIFYLLVLFPGTALYRDLLESGRVSDLVWEQKIEDLPWFEIDPDLDFERVKGFGDTLRKGFYSNLAEFAGTIELVDEKELYPFHADFLSRLAMTFSHGEYARNRLVKNPLKTARTLYRRALGYYPDHRAFLGLAMLFQKQRRFDKAVALLAQGVTHFSASKDLNICMAVSLMNLGRFKEALGCLEPFKEEPEVKPYIKACNRAM